MHYFRTLGTVLACLAVVGAQTPGFNPFITPAPGQDIHAGQKFDITWQPANAPNGATISIKLLQGQSMNAMQDGTNVASNIPADAGRFTWAVPRSIKDNEVYSLKMTLDGNEGTFQTSGLFDIDNLDNDDDNRPLTPTPNVNPPPPPQSQGVYPNNPGRFRPDDDDDDRYDDDDDDDDRFDDDNDHDDDDDFARQGLPGAIPSNPPAPKAASPKGVPKAVENPNNSYGNASPVVPPATPDTKAGTKGGVYGGSTVEIKPKNGTSTLETKAQASAGAPSNSKTTALASAGSPPMSKSTAPASPSNKSSSVPKPYTPNGATSLTFNSLFIVLGGITVIFAL